MKPGDVVVVKAGVRYLIDLFIRNPGDRELRNGTIGLIVAHMDVKMGVEKYPYVLFVCDQGVFWSGPQHLRLVHETR